MSEKNLKFKALRDFPLEIDGERKNIKSGAPFEAPARLKDFLTNKKHPMGQKAELAESETFKAEK